MTEAVFDFPDINRRISKDPEIFTPSKPAKKAKRVVECEYCDDEGWIPGVRANTYVQCLDCGNPDGKPKP